MPLPTQTIHLPLQQGQDTKGHKFAVQPPALTDAQNVVFDEVGAISKRTGSQRASRTTTRATTAYAKRVAPHPSGPLLLTEEGLPYSWVNGEWQSLEDQQLATPQYYLPCTLTQKPLPSVQDNMEIVDSALHESTGLRALTYIVDGTGYLVVCDADGSVVDIGTGLGAPDATELKVRAVGDYFHIYIGDTGANTFRLRTLDTTDPEGGTTQQWSYNSYQGYFDVTTYNDDAWVGWRFNSGAGNKLVTMQVEPDGTRTTVTTQSGGEAPDGPIGVAYTTFSTDYLVVVYQEGSSTKIGWYDIDGSFTGADVGHTLHTKDIAVFNVAVEVNDGSGFATVAICDYETASIVTDDTPAGVSVTIPYVKVVTYEYNSSTNTRSDELYRGYVLNSRIAKADTTGGSSLMLTRLAYYGWFSAEFQDTSINTHYLYVDLNKGDQSTDEWKGLVAVSSPGEAEWGLPSSTLGYVTDLYYNTTTEEITAATRFRLNVPTGTTFDVEDYFSARLDTLALFEAPQARLVGNTTYLPGGMLQQYDGYQVTEVGFLSYPDKIHHVTTASGGALSTGDYSYRVYWEWQNANGEYERSTSGASVTVTATANDSCTLYVPTLSATNKRGVRLAVFRTEADGDTYYRCSSTDPSDSHYTALTDRDAQYITFVDDTISDSVLVTQELDTTFNSGSLDNVHAFAQTAVSTAQNRLFYIGAEQDSRVYYSLLQDNRETFQFNETLQLNVPRHGGDLKAVEAAENALWIFRENATYVSSGEGPDNTGANGAYTTPTPVSSTIGCKDAGSVLQIPGGVIFKSSRGFYLADRGYNVRYIGAGVADYDSETVNGAVIQPETNRALFIMDNQTLVYDFLVGAWSVWDWTGTSICEAGGTTWWAAPTYAWYADSAVYTDNAVQYDMSITTSWIPLNGIAGYGRARRWSMLGEFKDDCAMKFEVGYDRKDAWTDEHIIDFSNTGSVTFTAGQSIKPRRRFSKQKTDAVRFRITDSTYNDGGITSVGNTVVINGLSLELGVKKNVVTSGQTNDIEATGVGQQQ